MGAALDDDDAAERTRFSGFKLQIDSHPNSTKLDYLGASNVRFERPHGKRFDRTGPAARAQTHHRDGFPHYIRVL